MNSRRSLETTALSEVGQESGSRSDQSSSADLFPGNRSVTGAREVGENEAALASGEEGVGQQPAIGLHLHPSAQPDDKHPPLLPFDPPAFSQAGLVGTLWRASLPPNPRQTRLRTVLP